MPIAIKAENLTKTYSISHQQRTNPSFRETIEYRIRKIVPYMRRGREIDFDKERSVENFMALDDISFEVLQGDRLGIIGENGAGKSTLLKILSRITEPSAGKVTIAGRVSSLLEVGTGFHPELTGRENVFLNGAVLGMPRSEIKKKFDEIVAFAEVEKFLDTPVKYYSSGMYVRLAFAVAAHLEPDILILDEVLAVGDVKFQQKCLKRMRHVSQDGQTVLFVSHSMQTIVQICSNAVLLDHGRVKASGPSADVVKAYMDIFEDDYNENIPTKFASYEGTPSNSDGEARLVSACIRNSHGDITSDILIREECIIEMEFEIINCLKSEYIANFHFYSVQGPLIFVASPPNGLIQNYNNGYYKVSCVVPAHLLNDGIINVMLALSSFESLDVVHFAVPNALSLHIKDDMVDLDYRNGYMKAIPGLVRPRLNWRGGRKS